MDPSIYRLRLRDILTLCVLGLLLLGVLIVQSAASRVTGDTAWSWNATGTKHMVFVILSMATFFAVGHLDYQRLLRNPKISLANPILWIFAIAVITCGLTLVPHIGKQINGARRWLALGPVFLQPSELA